MHIKILFISLIFSFQVNRWEISKNIVNITIFSAILIYVKPISLEKVLLMLNAPLNCFLKFSATISIIVVVFFLIFFFKVLMSPKVIKIKIILREFFLMII